MFKKNIRSLWIPICIGFTLISLSLNLSVFNVNYFNQSQIEFDSEDLFLKTSDSNLLWSHSYSLATLTAISQSSDGNYIVTGVSNFDLFGADLFQIQLFKKSSSYAQRYYLRDEATNCLAISSDGSYFVAGTENRLSFFDSSMWEEEWQYKTSIIFPSAFLCVDISADGSYIVGGSENEYVYLFQKSSSSYLERFSTSGNIISLAISADGNYIAAGVESDGVYLFDHDDRLWRNTTIGTVNSIDISDDGNYIVASSGNYVYLFDSSSSIPIQIHNLGDSVNSVSISADGEYYTVGCNDNKIYLYKTSGIPFQWSYSTNDRVTKVSITENGSHIMAGSDDDFIYLFNNSNSSQVWTEDIGNNVFHVSISRGGDYITAATSSQLSSQFMIYFGPDCEEFILTIEADNPDPDGSVRLSWTPYLDADNYTLYIQDEYIESINPSMDPYQDNITLTSCNVDDLTEGEHYFILNAHTMVGNFTSNCISVNVAFGGNGGGGGFNAPFNIIFIVLIIIIGFIIIVASISIYYPNRHPTPLKNVIKTQSGVIRRSHGKHVLELIGEVLNDSHAIKKYLNSKIDHSIIKDYGLAILNEEELKKINLITLNDEIKKQFIKEILTLKPEERMDLLNQMLSNETY